MADRVLMPRAFDSNGDIVTDATAYFYEVGTTTPLIVYTDSDGTVPLGTSAEGYADGSFDGVFTTEPLRMDMQNGAGVSLPGFPSDGWYVVPANGVGAGTITFEPQEGNTATNVQAAINNLTALWVAVTTYGKSLIAAADAAAAQETLGLGDNALLDFADLTNTTAEWQAGTATDYGYITPAQLKAAITSQKPVFAEAYVTYSGTTPTMVAESGMATVSRPAIGDTAFTFDTAQPDTNYVIESALQGGIGSSDYRYQYWVLAKSTAGFTVRWRFSTLTTADVDISVTCKRIA